MTNNDETYPMIRSRLPSADYDLHPSDATPTYDFVKLSEEIVVALVRAAENQVTEATNLLEQTKAFAESLHAQIEEKNRELVAKNNQLKVLGSDVLEAFRRYKGGD